jgi:hypothetical protein
MDTSLIVNSMSGTGRTAIVLLDACRNNPLSRSFQRSLGKTRSAAVGQGLAPLNITAGGVIIGFATAPGEVAADGDGRNSPFTTALLKNMNTPGLEIQQLMTRVKSDVYRDTKETQEPWHNSSLRSEVFLVPTSAAAEPSPAPSPEIPKAEQAPQQSNVEAEWAAVKDSESPAVLQAFMKKHADNPLYLALADERLNKLVGNGAGVPVAEPEGDAPPEAAPEGDAPALPATSRFETFLSEALDIINGTDTVPRTIPYLELKRPEPAPDSGMAKLGLKRLATAKTMEEFMGKVDNVPPDFQDFARCRVSNLASSSCSFMSEPFVGAMMAALDKRGLLGEGRPDFDIVKIDGSDDVVFATRPKRNDGEMTMAVALVSPDLVVKKQIAFNLSRKSYGIDAGDKNTRYEVMGAIVEGNDLYLTVDAGLRCKDGAPIKRSAGVMFRLSMEQPGPNMTIDWVTPFNVSDANMVSHGDSIYTATVGSCAPSFIYAVDKKSGFVMGREKLPNGGDKLMVKDGRLFVMHYPAASVYELE